MLFHYVIMNNEAKINETKFLLTKIYSEMRMCMLDIKEI